MNRENVIKLLGYGYFKANNVTENEKTTLKCTPFYMDKALCEIERVLGSKTLEVYNLDNELLAHLEKHFNANRDEMFPLMLEFGHSINIKEKCFFDSVENAIGYTKRGGFEVKNCGNK